MKSKIFLILAILFGLLWYQFRASQIRQEASLEPLTVPAAKPKPESKLVSPKTAKPKVGSKLSSDSSETTRVPFQVIDGWAVAYGDILLGVPEDETITEGIYNAPRPDLWEREIPYHIQPDITKTDRIRQALKYLEKNSGIHFVSYHDQKDAIIFERAAEHCLSLLGRQGGLQPIRLSDHCGVKEVLHEILHAMGFVHEHSRPDRDQYVEIVWDNIEPQYRLQFEKVPDIWMGATGDSPFDATSVMMYPTDFFSRKPGLQTIRPKGNIIIRPVTQGLSDVDLMRLRRLYPQ